MKKTIVTSENMEKKLLKALHLLDEVNDAYADYRVRINHESTLKIDVLTLDMQAILTAILSRSTNI